MKNKKRAAGRVVRGQPSIVPLRPSHVCMAALMALGMSAVQAQPAQPQEAQPAETAALQDGAASVTLDTVEVTGSADRNAPVKPIGNNAGASREDLERRNASHLTDVFSQISGTSMNSLYARPDVSIGIQGVAGYGRVSQSLEGVSQNFTAFTKDIGQTGSIYVEPQFLQSIAVSRGVNTSTGTLGSLGGSVNFKYLDLDDILQPGRQFGGMVRGSTGFSQYGNGQKPSGAAFIAGRNENWDVMLGVSRSKNDAYKVGSNFSDGAMLNDFNVFNMNFYDAQGQVDPKGVNCRYGSINGLSGGYQDGFNNCMLTPERLQSLKQSLKSGALEGTQRKADSQMLRLRHFFNDAASQSLELFASSSHSRYETDQEPDIQTGINGSEASWKDSLWSVKNQLNSRIANLKYKGEFNNLFNPTIQIYHKEQEYKQGWIGIGGSYAYNESLHYNIKNQSNGFKLSNSTHFSLPAVGNWRLDSGIEMRREMKTVDSLSEQEYLAKYYQSLGIIYLVPQWDADSRNTTQSVALNLSTDDDGPLKINAGVGFQRVAMDVLSPRYLSGNVSKAGTRNSLSNLTKQYLNEGYSSTEAAAMARADVVAYGPEYRIDGGNGTPGSTANTRYLTDDQHHHYDLKLGSLAVQYTVPGTGITPYASLGYSERAPTSSEMYISGAWMRQAFMANPNLKPEKNLSLQLGINYHHPAIFTQSDTFDAGVGFYRNRIKDYIGYGPLWMSDDLIRNGAGSYGQSVGSVNNLNDFIRQGFELNLAYHQPIFYIRGNLTLPLKHNNQMCSWTSPSGSYYIASIDSAGNTVYTRGIGNGNKQCYSGWSWMETSLIEPIQGSFTAAFTPHDGKLELGTTLQYRGKQRASYWYVKSVQNGNDQETSQEALPDNDGWLKAYLWPRVIKVDLFANYRVNKQLKLGVYLANLTNQFDGTPTSMGYNLYPGRTLTMNLEYVF